MNDFDGFRCTDSPDEPGLFTLDAETLNKVDKLRESYDAEMACLMASTSLRDYLGRIETAWGKATVQSSTGANLIGYITLWKEASLKHIVANTHLSLWEVADAIAISQVFLSRYLWSGIEHTDITAQFACLVLSVLIAEKCLFLSGGLWLHDIFPDVCKYVHGAMPPKTSAEGHDGFVETAVRRVVRAFSSVAP